MSYLKYTQYIYLAFGGYFIYDGISKWNSPDGPWLSFIVAALAIFMFFFRRRFAKRMEEYKKEK